MVMQQLEPCQALEISTELGWAAQVLHTARYLIDGSLPVSDHKSVPWTERTASSAAEPQRPA